MATNPQRRRHAQKEGKTADKYQSTSTVVPTLMKMWMSTIESTMSEPFIGYYYLSYHITLLEILLDASPKHGKNSIKKLPP